MKIKIFIILLFFAIILQINQKTTQLQDFSALSFQENQEAEIIIDKINNINSQFDSVIYNNISIKFNFFISIHANAQLFFEKTKRLRIKIDRGIMGSEMDIGSNEKIFWFWSKRMKPPVLYYSEHEDFKKSMLKTPLNPDWIIECFGFNQIDKRNINVFKKNELLYVKQERKGSLGEKVYFFTIIDPKNLVVVGRYLHDENYKIIASFESKSFFRDEETGSVFADNIVISWPDENIFMEWSIDGIQVNKKIDKKTWILPSKDNVRL